MQSSYDHYREVIQGDRERPTYKNLKILTDPAIHQHVAELASRHFPPGCRVMELGAGSGAMSLRMADAGFDVVATDLLADNYQLHGRVPFLTLDLNNPVPTELAGRAAGLVAIELIEHLENPRHLLRQIRALLSPGGLALLTTPNIANPVSLALFARTGAFSWFDDTNYRALGHITPMSALLFQRAAEEAGLVVEEISSIGDPYHLVKGWPAMVALAKILAWISKPAGQPAGDVLIARLRKP